jgi:hypothetical protein
MTEETSTPYLNTPLRSNVHLKRQRSLLDIGCEMEQQKRRRRISATIVGDSLYSTSPPLKRQRTKKNVQFAPRTVTCLYPHISEDTGKAWYARSDFKNFADECRFTLKSLDDVGGEVAKLDPSSKEKLCTRGLEHQLFPEVFQAKKQRQQELVRMILYQQKMYKATGKVNPGRMRAISLMFSQEAKEWAIDFGSKRH